MPLFRPRGSSFSIVFLAVIVLVSVMHASAISLSSPTLNRGGLKRLSRRDSDPDYQAFFPNFHPTHLPPDAKVEPLEQLDTERGRSVQNMFIEEIVKFQPKSFPEGRDSIYPGPESPVQVDKLPRLYHVSNGKDIDEIHAFFDVRRALMTTVIKGCMIIPRVSSREQPLEPVVTDGGVLDRVMDIKGGERRPMGSPRWPPRSPCAIKLASESELRFRPASAKGSGPGCSPAGPHLLVESSIHFLPYKSSRLPVFRLPFYLSSNLLSERGSATSTYWFKFRASKTISPTMIALSLPMYPAHVSHEGDYYPLSDDGWPLMLGRIERDEVITVDVQMSTDQRLFLAVGPFELQYDADHAWVNQRQGDILSQTLVPIGRGRQLCLYFGRNLWVPTVTLRDHLERFTNIPALEDRVIFRITNHLEFQIAVMIVWVYSGWKEERNYQGLLRPEEVGKWEMYLREFWRFQLSRQNLSVIRIPQTIRTFLRAGRSWSPLTKVQPTHFASSKTLNALQTNITSMTRPTASSRVLAILFLGAAISSGILAVPTPSAIPKGPGSSLPGAQALQSHSGDHGPEVAMLQRRGVVNLVPRLEEDSEHGQDEFNDVKDVSGLALQPDSTPIILEHRADQPPRTLTEAQILATRRQIFKDFDTVHSFLPAVYLATTLKNYEQHPQLAYEHQRALFIAAHQTQLQGVFTRLEPVQHVTNLPESCRVLYVELFDLVQKIFRELELPLPPKQSHQ
ncbi:hypothetical protein EV360DRAFT_75802 [Lentinula raphanica]|nr:hypothetical protein EV360DRAFT_75802 [Lentinula raphanica]